MRPGDRGRILRTALASVLALLLLAAPSRAAEARPAPGRYHLQSRFWVGLHQTLLEAAQRGGVTNPGGDASERQLWERAVAVYRQRFAKESVFDDELMTINDALSQVEDAAELPPAVGPIADTLQEVAGVYRQRQWPADVLANRFWMAVAGAMLDQAGEELVAAHEQVYGAKYPAHVTVDVSPFGGEFGAYTTIRNDFVHTTVSTRDPAYQGYWGHPFILEMYKRTFQELREPLATHWQAYLDGKLSREEAIRRLVEATTAPAAASAVPSPVPTATAAPTPH